MARPCTICTYPQQQEIDKALFGPTSIREIAALFRVSQAALARHKAAHLPLTLANAEETRQVEQAKDVVAHALDVVQQLKATNALTWRIAAEARDTHDHDLALRAIDRIQRQLALQARLLGDLEPEGRVNITIHAEWIRIRAGLMTALAPYPEARSAVARALLKIEQ